MNHTNELQYSVLKKECDPAGLGFKTTEEIDFFEGIIGQERAVRAMEFGLKIRTKGYNIYISGSTGTGKTSYAVNLIKGIAGKEKIPDDWCYINNFKNPSCPVAVTLTAGTGKVFQKDMDEFIKIIQTEIPKAFDSEDYEKEKAGILKEYQAKRNVFLEQLGKDAEKYGFKVKTTNAGIYFLPVVEGKTLNEQEYSDLSEELRNEITKKTNEIQMETMEIMRKIKNLEKEAEDRIVEWENKIALFAVGIHINDLKEKYKAHPKLMDFFEGLQEDILQNFGEFIEEEPQDEQQQLLLPLLKKGMESPFDRYKVNLLVENSSLEGAPVIVDYNPTFYNLLGKMEYENEFGTMTTDFTMIKAGLLHQANGGYLVLQVKDVLSNVFVWESLKRVLKTKQINIENMKEQMGLVAVSTLKPEPIPVSVKVILVGSEYIYQLLLDYDEDFSKLFKVKVDFDDEMDRKKENIFKLVGFIASFCRREGALHFDAGGVARVVEYSSRLVEDQGKMSTKFNDIVEVLAESCAWAGIMDDGIVRAEHVKKAIEEKKYRSDKYDKKLQELMENDTIMIDTQGAVVGQINGLSVLDMGDYAFGKPSRITATTYMGKSGIVNIEREVEMSGTSHSKGVLILNGYIGQKFAQEVPLSLSANLCFEQLYGGIDGDSASSTELYAIISSLAEIPIRQGIAVTGSVNQKGEIQPIGGVNEKIEGFFELCKVRGLTGEQGVIIPWQNVKNLMLSDEVVKAVKDGKFHIYSIRNIDEGIEILTGVKAGEKQADGSYPHGTVNFQVFEKLKRFSKAVEEHCK